MAAPWRVELVTLDGAAHPIALAGLCLGLAGEADAAVELLERTRPHALALALDPDLAADLDQLDVDGSLNTEDEAYVAGLSRWGEVTLPAPAYPRLVEAAKAAGIVIEGIDLPEVAYVDRFTAEIGVPAMARRWRRARRLGKRPPAVDDPATFCRRFDERLNAGAYRHLEEAREATMADGIERLVAQGPVLFVCEVQRLDGVTARLERALGARATVRRT